MAARISQRSRNAMQSGKARTEEWVLQFESHSPHVPDPLTGWSGGSDTHRKSRSGSRRSRPPSLCRARGHRLPPRPATQPKLNSSPTPTIFGRLRAHAAGAIQ